MSTKSIGRGSSFLIIIAIYALAFVTGLLIFNLTSYMGTLLALFLADVAATVIVWAFGGIFKNSSVYDPYWSVAPIALIIALILNSPALTLSGALPLIAICVWGIRLTLNWALRWDGLHHQDWRYIMYKENFPKLWLLINFFGINLMPTILVFFGMAPVYYSVISKAQPGLISYLGLIVCIFAAAIQLTADRQMDAFKKRGGGICIEEGIWKYSRHPNYFGEVSFWWGIWLIQIGIVPELWLTVIGPLLITALFCFVSVPLMEKHLIQSKPEYAEYKKRVSMLIPLGRR